MSRALLLELYDAALRAVDGRARTAAWLRDHPPATPVHVIAVGKAAAAMLQGAIDVLGEGVQSAFMVTKHGHDDPALAADSRVQCLSAGHPVPDADSFAAGSALIDYIAGLPAAAEVLVLLSGGASSLIEAPVGGMSQRDIARATGFLLANGWEIGDMNRLRKRWSRLKGGGVAELLGGRRVEVLLISDVPGDDPAMIGSGPLWPGVHTVDLPELPEWLAERLPAARGTNAPPPPHHLIATNADACAAALASATARNVVAHPLVGTLDGDVLAAAARIAAHLANAPDGVHVWGGEATVRLPENPGRGGRNQQLALALARRIAGRDDLIVLAAGTDGTDGPGFDAGALVDGGSVARGEVEGLSVDAALQAADAGTFLAASGDLINTGPTGTNVMDMVIAIKGPGGRCT